LKKAESELHEDITLEKSTEIIVNPEKEKSETEKK